MEMSTKVVLKKEQLVILKTGIPPKRKSPV